MRTVVRARPSISYGRGGRGTASALGYEMDDSGQVSRVNRLVGPGEGGGVEKSRQVGGGVDYFYLADLT